MINGETGLVLPAGNVAAWRNGLTTYADRVDDLRCMGDRARYRMETLFDARNYAPRMLDLYTAALREPVTAKH